MRKSQHVQNQAGVSLVELLVVVAIISFIGAAFASMILSQQKEGRSLAEKLSSLDLQQLLISTFADGSVCTYLMTDSSQANNRSASTFNVNDLQNQTITFKNLPARAAAGAAIVAALDEAVSPLAPHLKVSEIAIRNIQGSSDYYTADLQISFSGSVRALKPISVKTILQTDSASPANAKTITGCSGGTLIGKLSPITSTGSFNGPVDVAMGVHKMCFLINVTTVHQTQACGCSLSTSAPGNWTLHGGADTLVPSGYCRCSAQCLD